MRQPGKAQCRSESWFRLPMRNAGMVDLLRSGKLPSRGFVRQEEVALAGFLGNRFGGGVRVRLAPDAAYA